MLKIVTYKLQNDQNREDATKSDDDVDRNLPVNKVKKKLIYFLLNPLIFV